MMKRVVLACLILVVASPCIAKYSGGSGEPEPCGLTAYGEAEDYTIDVVSTSSTFKISGHIRLSDSRPLSGVIVTSSPGGVTDISDANGYYEITLTGPWTGHLNRYKEGWAFTLGRYYINVTTDQTENMVAYWSYSGGIGTSGSPYLIATPNDMNSIGAHPEDWGKHFKLINDIDLSAYTGTDYSIIGTSTSKPFSGVFDGNGHTISNFTYTTSSNLIDIIGLFGYVKGNSAEIKNLALRDPNIISTVTYKEGTLVGILDEGNISNCCVDGGNINGFWSGGLVGENNLGTINDCYFSGSVTAGGAGGLISHNRGGTMFRCFSKGMVSGYSAVGGLVGESSDISLIADCYSESSVTGLGEFAIVGGLVGYSIDYSAVNRCYSAGKVFGTSSYVGGLIGWLYGGWVTDSFWDTQTSGQDNSDGGTGLQTNDMQRQSTFTDAGWNFVDIWAICETTNYPKLLWQIMAGDIVCPDGVDTYDLAELCEQWLFEEIPADLAPPPAGDGIVDFADFSIFANQWGITNDIVQLLDFTGQWLKIGLLICSADLSPLPDGDGRVDAEDFAIMANDWLEGF